MIPGVVASSGLIPTISGPTGVTTAVGSFSDQKSSNVDIIPDLTQIAYAIKNFAFMSVRADGVLDPIITLTAATGWQQLFQVRIEDAGRFRTEAVFWKVLDSASEVNPVMKNSESEAWSVALQVFASSLANPTWTITFDPLLHRISGEGNSTPTNQPITTATDGETLILTHGWIESGEMAAIGLPASPTGMVQGPTVNTLSNARQVIAYKLDAGPAGVKTPSAWTHVHTAEKDFTCHTFALRAA